MSEWGVGRCVNRWVGQWVGQWVGEWVDGLKFRQKRERQKMVAIRGLYQAHPPSTVRIFKFGGQKELEGSSKCHSPLVLHENRDPRYRLLGPGSHD